MHMSADRSIQMSADILIWCPQLRASGIAYTHVYAHANTNSYTDVNARAYTYVHTPFNKSTHMSVYTLV